MKQLIATAEGYHNSLMLIGDGEVYTLGENNKGEYRASEQVSINNLHKIKEIPKKVIRIAAGNYHFLALTEEGKFIAGAEMILDS